MSFVLVQVIAGGLLLGAVYALFSSGLTLVWGMMNIVNFAHGDFVMLGMYVAFMVFTLFGAGPLVGAPLATIVLATLGVVVYFEPDPLHHEGVRRDASRQPDAETQSAQHRGDRALRGSQGHHRLTAGPRAGRERSKSGAAFEFRVDGSRRLAFEDADQEPMRCVGRCAVMRENARGNAVAGDVRVQQLTRRARRLQPVRVLKIVERYVRGLPAVPVQSDGDIPDVGIVHAVLQC